MFDWVLNTPLLSVKNKDKLLYEKLYSPSLWMGFICLKATEPLRGDSLLFTTKSPGVMSIRLIDLGNAESTLESPSGFEPVLMRSFKKIFFPNCD